MFLIQHIDRDASREQFNKIYRIMRKVGERGSIADESLLAERQEIQQTIAKYAVDDEICVVQSGRDCDCVEYVHSSIVKRPTVMKLWGDRQDTYAWADGPCYVGFCSPEDRPNSQSRDLAMEAYEDGHPHYVTSATV